jgi:hypothetical protein
MVLPNFLGLGVGKAGTTTLHYILRQHPDVLLVPEKEARFFSNDANYAKGLEWYSEKFSKYSGQSVIGDITPAYFISPEAHKRIAESLNENIKLILILRHPVTRAYSHYLHNVRLLLTNDPFFDGSRILDDYYVDCSMYSKRLEHLFQLFPRENMLTLIYERDIHGGNLSGGFQKVSRHLGLRDVPINLDIHKVKAFVPIISYVEQPRIEISGQTVHSVQPGDVVVETIRDSDVGVQKEIIYQPAAEKVAWLADFVANVTRSLPSPDIQRLEKEYFAEDIQFTRELLGDPIPEWEWK